jgi:hypothetical protein
MDKKLKKKEAQLKKLGINVDMKKLLDYTDQANASKTSEKPVGNKESKK